MNPGRRTMSTPASLSANPERRAVIEAAGRLFAEHGYATVTIRQIAEAAGVSPALVMKIGGTKASLFGSLASSQIEPLGDEYPRDRVALELLRRIEGRHESKTVEPWIQAVVRVIDAPDPEEARKNFDAVNLAFLRRFMLGDDNVEARVDMVASMLLGFAIYLNRLSLGQRRHDVSWAIPRYAAMIQIILDTDDLPVD
jgi:AcrR family transcriptional regulator